MGKIINGTQIVNKKYKNKIFENYVWSNGSFEKVVFENCKFLECFFNNINFEQVKFVGCNIVETAFSFSTFSKKCLIEKTLVDKSSFFEVEVKQTTFLETKITNSVCTKEKLAKTNKFINSEFNEFFTRNINPSKGISKELEDEMDGYYTNFVKSFIKKDDVKIKSKLKTKGKRVVENKDFSKKSLQNVNLNNKIFKNCCFELANFAFKEIENSAFINCNMQKSCLSFSKFLNCYIENSNIKKVNGYKMTFSKCYVNANFSYSNLSHINFANSDLEKSNFLFSMFRSPKFFSNIIKKCSFVDCAFYNIISKNNQTDHSVYRYNKKDFNNLIYLSIRESDGAFVDYKKSVSVFGSGKRNNVALNKITKTRFNHNAEKNFDFIDDYFLDYMRDVMKNNPEKKFVYYGKNRVALLPPDVQKNIENQSNQEIIELLDDKFKSRMWLKDFVPCTQYKFLKGKDISMKACKNLFGKKFSKFVVQSDHSSGGSLTFFLNDKSEKDVLGVLEPQKDYSVTTFIKGISINVHFLIAEKNEIISPASVQLIDTSNNKFEYSGCDFASYDKLISKKMRNRVLEVTRILIQKLREKGYRGIGGIDYIVADDVYFIEVNPRFQASTNILNLALKENSLPSINELDAMCFKRKSLPELPPYKVKYSKVSLINGQKNKIKGKPYYIFKDGFSKDEKLDDEVYLYSLVYKKGIYNEVFKK